MHTFQLRMALQKSIKIKNTTIGNQTSVHTLNHLT